MDELKTFLEQLRDVVEDQGIDLEKNACMWKWTYDNDPTCEYTLSLSRIKPEMNAYDDYDGFGEAEEDDGESNEQLGFIFDGNDTVH